METVEEFFRKKVQAINPGVAVITLSQELIRAESGLRWAKEYSDLHNAELKAESDKLREAIQYYFDVLEEVMGADWKEKPDHVLAKMLNAMGKAEIKFHLCPFCERPKKKIGDIYFCTNGNCGD